MKKNIFNTIKVNAPQYNTFDLTHDVKMSCKMGDLVPTLAMEVVPGDRVKLACDSLVRFAPMIAPVMHRINIFMHYFFVPNRIVWDSWEDFISNEATGGLPFLNWSSVITAAQKRFGDYMGVPPNDSGVTVPINALAFAAYQRIWFDWYRDENLQPESTYPKPELTDGNNTAQIATLAVMRKRAWEHDYFTAALPFAQKGTAVQLPIGEVILDPAWTSGGLEQPNFVQNTGGLIAGNLAQVGTVPLPTVEVGGIGIPTAYDPQGTLQTNPTTINELRRAEKLQQWLEINARSGTRYNELIYGHFAERVKDYRLQRAEYITGTKSPVIISEVLNTTGEVATGGLPQGNMAGHGVSVGKGYNGNFYVPEHGYIIGIMSVMPLPAYQQGIPRHYLVELRDDPLNWYWPSFAHIGEQEIINEEIFAYTGTGPETWGYIPRYAEYKYMANRVAGDFRTTLNFWHLGRIFASLPPLAEEFLQVDNSPENTERIFAVQAGDDNLWCHILHKIVARRKMPVFGTPML